MDGNSIILKFNEFANFLNEVDLEALKKTMSRQELNELSSTLRQIKIRSLSYEIGQMTDKMKEEEYPELLGVHHYPELKEIDFLSEATVIDLDKYLGESLRVVNYVHRLYDYGGNDTEKLKQFLLDKGIIKEVYFVCCPICHDETVSGSLTKAELEEVKAAIISRDCDRYKVIDKHLTAYCDECDCHLEFLEKWDDFTVNTEYILAKERDNSLNNV